MKAKLIVLISLFLVVAFPFMGCDMPFGKEVTYTFLQDWENVIKVEICYHDVAQAAATSSALGPTIPLAELSEEQIASLKEDLLAVPANEVNVRMFGLDELLFVITYSDKKQEMISLSMAAEIRADGSFERYREFAFTNDPKMVRVFAKYADPQILGEYFDDFWRLYDLADEY